MKNFSNPVFAARNRLGLSQQELAEMLGVSKNYVWMMEAGRKPIGTKILEKLDSLEAGKSETITNQCPPDLFLRAVLALERIAAALEKPPPFS